jgi:thiamine pyrophosphate-dependent acetolactate synthase large subunit-like protein
VSPLPVAADIVAETVAGLGTTDVFGLVGSNLALVNALRRSGIPYYGACHESGAGGNGRRLRARSRGRPSSGGRWC